VTKRKLGRQSQTQRAYIPTVDLDVAAVTATAFEKALQKGTAGAQAGAVQVITLMWLRTTLNYQYRYGLSTKEALATLYKEGGLSRLYQGLPFALVQGPLSRFGDTAANALVIGFLDASASTLPTYASTLLASLAAGGFRILLMPVDTAKTTLQVNGGKGLDILKERLKKEGASALFSGALAASAATVVGHYPWFLTFNTLSAWLPTPQEIADAASLVSLSASHENTNTYIDSLSTLPLTSLPLPAMNFHDLAVIQLSHVPPKVLNVCRSAFIGLCSSTVSDLSSNSLRVLKTTRQAQEGDMTYLESAKQIIDKEGLAGLFGRGLQTRILSNSVQGVVFSVLLKLFSAEKR
jgi:hypothetical protein